MVSTALMQIFTLSPFVKNQFEKSPELEHLFLEDKFNLNTDWHNYKNEHIHKDVFSLLRGYRQSRLALIAARDLIDKAPEKHLNTLKDVSLLARLMIVHAHKTAHLEQVKKYGELVNTKGQLQHFIIFALGKLGGNELNYSSDVDLIFCYSDDGQSNGNKTLDAQNYFVKLGRRIIQILNSITIDGIVYKVDMRLRPFGNAAPLVCSLSHLHNYLETEGRDWERYAYLRASTIVGEQQLCHQSLKNIEPFVYRKYLDYNIFESLRQIKEQIIRKQINDQNNIKLGKGGIREIEFIVQTLQLTFAGRNKLLRGNDIWLKMQHLKDHLHLSANQLKKLQLAWLFLRKVENLCQIINDTDTHHLPKDIEPIAQCMNLNNQELLQQLDFHRTNVHGLFKHLFLLNQSKNTDQSNKTIQTLKDDIYSQSFPKSIKHKLYAALDAIVPLLSKHNNQKVIIQRYQKVIESVSRRINYLSMLIESPLILEKLITLLSHSDYFSNAIAKTPALLEVLFDEIQVLDFDFPYQWMQLLKKHSTFDFENHLETLNQFKQAIHFKAVMLYVDDKISSDKTCEILSDLAQFILSLVVHQAWMQITEKIDSTIKSDDLIIIAYGSLAMKTMHINSDFDIVFVLDYEISPEDYKFIMRWIKRIIHLLTVPSYSGKLYELDIQLRPNGQSGAAIVSRDNFEKYQLNDAWLWEHAALVKSRAVYATSKQNQWFSNLRKKVLTQPRTPETVEKELGEMAKKLNQFSTKNHQKEFLALNSILINAHKHPKIIDQLAVFKKNSKAKLNLSIH